MPENDLPAGPELDRLIAEKAIGWRWNEHQNWYEGSGGGTGRVRTSFAPSQNISDAWEVVEALKAAEWTFEMVSEVRWYVHLGHDEHHDARGEAETAPLAICRAALAAARA